MKKAVIVVLILSVILLVVFIFFVFKNPGNNISECQSNNDCVAAGCCHPGSCTTKNNMPNCSNSLCSSVCSGPLDCGAGYCGCVNNKCAVVPNE